MYKHKPYCTRVPSCTYFTFCDVILLISRSSVCTGTLSPTTGTKEHKNAERGDGNEYDAECNNPIYRQPKIDPEQFPWSESDRIEGSTLQDECAATRNIITNYTFNIKLTKAHLLNSGAAPEFPDTEWRSLLSGLAINLDTVFSG